VGKAEAASPALRKDLRLQSENEELIWLFEYGMDAIRYDRIRDKELNYRAPPLGVGGSNEGFWVSVLS
jgi:hypothetical protein